jgi:hypothetical protein
MISIFVVLIVVVGLRLELLLDLFIFDCLRRTKRELTALAPHSY